MIITITELELNLKKARKENQQEGQFGLKECKKQIIWEMNFYNKSLQEIYCEKIKRGLTERLFNLNMIIACEQLLNEK